MIFIRESSEKRESVFDDYRRGKKKKYGESGESGESGGKQAESLSAVTVTSFCDSSLFLLVAVAHIYQFVVLQQFTSPPKSPSPKWRGGL